MGRINQGKGPRTTTPPEGTEVTSGLTLGDDDKPQVDYLGSDVQFDRDADLITQGIHYAKPVVQQFNEFTDEQWQYQETTAERITLMTESQQTEESVLWKRIFEFEEEFLAPVEIPKIIPGVSPW